LARQRLTYRERDLSAAIKIMQERGIKVGRVDIDKDGVHIVPAGNDAAEAEKNELEADRIRIRKIIDDM
jgi:hypothetical protein